MSDSEDNKSKAVSWLTSLLSGWGIKESWAQYIAAAIVGAVAAVLVMMQTSCTTSVTQGADGSWSYSSELIPPANTIPMEDSSIVVKTLDGEEK